MRCLLIVCLLICTCLTAQGEELRLMSDTSEIWHEREPPQAPETNRELLAQRAAESGSTVSDNNMTAYYLGQKHTYELVTVEEAPESSDGVHAINSYQLRHGLIYHETKIKFLVKPNQLSEQIARELALDYLHNRTVAGKPVVMNGHLYNIERGEKCQITVTERSGETVLFTYRYRSCR